SGARAARGTRVGSARPAGGARRACARPALRGTLSGRGALPRDSPDEERPESLEVERRLFRLPHALHDDRQRMELRAEEPDDEVVVVAVEAVAREPDVEAETRAAECHSDATVLHEDRVLLPARELLERTRPPERVPDRPCQIRVEDTVPRAVDERL